MEPKRTYISNDEVESHRSRVGFMSATAYGAMAPEQNEIGSIATKAGEPEQVWPGLWRTPVICIERIFIKEVDA